MIKNLFFLVFIVIVEKSFSMPIVKDTIPDSYGWMIFINDDVIWVPASISEKIKSKDFFRNYQYENGLDVKAFIEAPQYKKVAKSYVIQFGYGPGRVAVLPVKAKTYKSSATEGSEILTWSFTKKEQQITIKYQFAATYYTGEISLIRKCDKRKYKKNKKELLHTQ